LGKLKEKLKGIDELIKKEDVRQASEKYI